MTESMIDVEDAWSDFMNGQYETDIPKTSAIPDLSDEMQILNTPKCGELSISTKTIISYLSHPVDLKEVFWRIPITPYSTTKEGIIKKQMKVSATTQEELDNILFKVDEIKDIAQEKNEEIPYIENAVLTHISNPGGLIPFKAVHKISIGLSKKDIASYRCKKRSAFYNCFVVILRVFHDDKFREIHIKVFNTGKLEIPGIQTPGLLPKTLHLLVKCLRPLVLLANSEKLDCDIEKSETVLINSNFNCGYYINRERLYEILRKKYKISSAYDPCSYPGIQSEFYYDTKKQIQDGQQPSKKNEAEVEGVDQKKTLWKVSFMMFRTGSVLIVGKCSEIILNEIYEFLQNVLKAEYKNIHCGTVADKSAASDKKRAPRKRTILIYPPKATN